VKYLDVSECGLDWNLPLVIISRLRQFDVLKCVSPCNEIGCRLLLPPAHVCSGGVGHITNFFFDPELKDLEDIAESMSKLMDASGPAIASVVLDCIRELWLQSKGAASCMAQQLWVSLISHKMSNECLPLIAAFLDEHLECVLDLMKWKDYCGRSAAATALTLCKQAMHQRSLFMGVYDLKAGARHEYKSATCIVYLVDLVKGEERIPVALKFMKNLDEFEREIASRTQLLVPFCGGEQKQQDCIIQAIDFYHCTNVEFRNAVSKRKCLVEYDEPCLLVMPAADRNLRAIMDNERITNQVVIKNMFHRISECVKYMHDRGFIHGDLKPRNVVRFDGLLKIIDFDASAQIGKQFSWSKFSSAYLPPEAICLKVSLRGVDFVIADASDCFRSTVSFSVSLLMGIPSGTSPPISDCFSALY
jgi:hypothetical protein